MQTKTHKIISIVNKTIDRERKEQHNTIYQLTLIGTTLYLDTYQKGEWKELKVFTVNSDFSLKNAVKRILRKSKFNCEFEKRTYNQYILHLN